MNDFIYNQIEVVPGCLFNQYDTIKKTHLYVNKKFQDNRPYQGRAKLFFDVATYRRDTIAKSIDIDTKDIKLIADNPESDIQTFIAEKEFKYWLKDSEFGEILNELGDDLATYGSIVLKCVASKVENVDLRRLFLDPTVKNIRDSRFITQEIFMTQSELEAMSGKWDNIDEVITKFGSYYAPMSYENTGQQNVIGSTPYYKIYERYGEVPEYMLDDNSNSDKLVRAFFVVAEPQAVMRMQNGTELDEGVVLFKSKWNKLYPYEDLHYKRIKGRWLGVGAIEDLFQVQERFNEIANQKRVSMEISALHFFQTQDKKAPNNLLKYSNNADVIVTSGISPIANEERNLPAFQSEEEMYNQLADRLTFAYDASRGEAMPSSTPATNAVIQNNNINSFFSKKRENFGLFITRVMNNHILPQLLKDISNEHILRFIGTPEDMAKFDNLITPYYVTDEVIKRTLAGESIYAPELEKIKNDVQMSLKKQGSQRFTKIKQDFYKNSKFMFDFVVTDEQQDTAVIAQNMFKLISDLSQNPAVLDDPVLKVFYFKYASMIGISPMELELATQKRQEAQANQQQPQQLSQAQTAQTTNQTEQQPIPTNVQVAQPIGA